MAKALGRMAGVGIGLWVAMASGAEVSRLVKARVLIGAGFVTFRHEVSVSNRDTSRSVTSVLLWQDEGLWEEPKDLAAPKGWEVRALARERPSGVSWAVEFACRPAPESERPSQVSLSDTADEVASCGIRAGQTTKFIVILPYRSESLERQQIFVGFSDGRLGIAS